MKFQAIGAVLLATVLSLVGCAGRGEFPAIHDSDLEPARHGKFVWYDLLTEDVEAVQEFYGELLGWEFRRTGRSVYWLIEHNGRPIGGLVDMSRVDPNENQSQWVSVLSVADVDVAARTTSNAGGTVHVEPKDLPGRGRFAIVSDPQGAMLALLTAVTGDPPDRQADPGEWLWTELWTNDPAQAQDFYGELAGYRAEREQIAEGLDYTVLKRGDVPRAGLILNPFQEHQRDNWLPYVRVEDPRAMAERVEELGGRLVIAPDEEIRRGSVTVVIDPSGAALALQQWPLPQGDA